MTDATSQPTDLIDMEFDLVQPPQKVWRALTEPDMVSRWIVPDHPSTSPDAADRATAYEVIDAEPGQRVSYRWRDGQAADSVVTFTISGNVQGGTRLRVVHSQVSAVALAGAPPCIGRGGSGRPLPAANSNLAPLCRAA